MLCIFAENPCQILVCNSFCFEITASSFLIDASRLNIVMGNLFLTLNVRSCQQGDDLVSCMYFFFYTTQSLMNSSKEEMRELAALFYSVVVSTVSGNELKSMIEQLIKTTKDNHVCYHFVCILFFVENSFTKASNVFLVLRFLFVKWTHKFLAFMIVRIKWDGEYVDSVSSFSKLEFLVSHRHWFKC